MKGLGLPGHCRGLYPYLYAYPMRGQPWFLFGQGDHCVVGILNHTHMYGFDSNLPLSLLARRFQPSRLQNWPGFALNPNLPGLLLLLKPWMTSRVDARPVLLPKPRRALQPLLHQSL